MNIFFQCHAADRTFAWFIGFDLGMHRARVNFAVLHFHALVLHPLMLHALATFRRVLGLTEFLFNRERRLIAREQIRRGFCARTNLWIGRVARRKRLRVCYRATGQPLRAKCGSKNSNAHDRGGDSLVEAVAVRTETLCAAHDRRHKRCSRRYRESHTR